MSWANYKRKKNESIFAEIKLVPHRLLVSNRWSIYVDKFFLVTLSSQIIWRRTSCAQGKRLLIISGRRNDQQPGQSTNNKCYPASTQSERSAAKGYSRCVKTYGSFHFIVTPKYTY